MRANPTTVYVGMGANLGNKQENLLRALQAMDAIAHTRVKRVSSLYSSEPVGFLEQDIFLNAVAELTTCLEPEELLQALQKIENELGRVRSIRWGPRTLDLDILLYGQEEVENPQLTIPHPRVTERAFVLIPLAELAPEISIAKKAINNLLPNVADQKINLFKKAWFGKLD